MSSALPHKLQKIFEQTAALVLPTAIRAGGPVLVTMKREDGEPTPDKRGMFIQQFKRCLTEQFAQTAKKPDDKNEAAAKKMPNTREAMEERISKYSLVDSEQLEVQLLIDRLCNALQVEHQFDVDCLAMRLERMAGITIERSNNPLCTKHLTNVFLQCCDVLQPTKMARDAAMTNWGKALKEAYPQWLKQLNQLLIKQHILPRLDLDDISRRYEKKNQDKAREMRKNLIEDITGKPQDADSEVSSAELMRSLNALVANAAVANPELNKHIVTGTAGGTIATKADVFDAISNVSSAAQINTETGYRELPDNIPTLAEKVALLPEMQAKALDSQTQNAISLLSMMFDRLQSEEQIAAPIKPLIDELQIPILKVAVQDQDFFSNPDNPAQELINEIAQVGTQWTPKQNINKDPFYKKISSFVDDISASAESIENHEGFFEEKLITLKDFLEREKQRSALLEERIIQAESMKARTESARETAEKIILKKVIRHNAKPNTANFLQEYWQHVLFFYINRDEDYVSDEQQQARKVIDDLLIFKTETLSTSFDKVCDSALWHLHHMGLALTEQETTLANLRNEFNSAQQEIKDEQAAAAEAATKKAEQEQAAARAAAELTSSVSSILARTETETATTPESAPITPATPTSSEDFADNIFGSSASATTTSTDISFTIESLPLEATIDEVVFEEDDDFEEVLAIEDDFALEDIFDKQADMLRADTWFRLSNATHDKLKVKLAAVIKHNGNYIFVNREGAKIITAKKSEVAELLRCGELSIIDDTIFFDRALESVIQSLRK